MGSRVVWLSRTRLVCVKLARTAAIPTRAGPRRRYRRFEQALAQFFELDSGIHLPPPKSGLAGVSDTRGIPFRNATFGIRYARLSTGIRDCQPQPFNFICRCKAAPRCQPRDDFTSEFD